MSMEFPEIFDPATEEGNSWELVPPGEYPAHAIAAEVKAPSTGDGHGLTLTWKILEGNYEGRQVWQHITITHSNQQAQNIGRKMIKDICVALGIDEQLNSAEPFLYKPARIRVGIEVDKKGQYDDKNVVRRVKVLVLENEPKPTPPSDTTAAKSAPAPRTQGAPRPGPAGPAPWHRTK